MYTKAQFGKDLKDQLLQNKSSKYIGGWAYFVYTQYMLEIDLSLRELLLALGTMELGPEFEYTQEELIEIANKLIAGEDVKL